jgi:predicted Zn finger-like uncharacterized protein
MALATQCPHCHTAFRVANDQLKLHAGLVRCGACQQTFNGIEYLLAPGHSAQTVTTPTVQIPLVPPASPAAAEETSVTPALVPVATAQESIPPASSDSSDSSDSPNSTELPEPTNSTDALEFDLGDELAPQASADDQATAQDSNQNPAEEFEQKFDQEPDLAQEIGQFELETRSTLMNQSDSDWSVSELQEDQRQDSLAASILAAEHLVPVEHGDQQTYQRKEPVYSELDLDALNAASINDNLSDNLSDPVSDAGAADRDDENDSDSEQHLEKPDFVVKAEKKQKRSKLMRALLAVLTLLLLLSLLAQATHTLRDTIAAWLPQTKPALQDLCRRLHCQIALPSQIEMISIESNELEAIDAGKKIFSLALQLQNKSGTLQNWPMLELILNDGKGKTLLQKVFTPDEYLSNKSDIAKGFSAGSEQSVKLFFELSGLKASGYHVGVFYP